MISFCKFSDQLKAFPLATHLKEEKEKEKKKMGYEDQTRKHTKMILSQKTTKSITLNQNLEKKIQRILTQFTMRRNKDFPPKASRIKVLSKKTFHIENIHKQSQKKEKERLH